MDEVDYGGLSEELLVTLARNQDPQAFVELTRRTRPASLRTATAILRDADAAQDQLQNAYLNAWRHIGRFRSEAKFSTWIGRIVTNQCLMALRSRRVSPIQFFSAEEGEMVLEFPDTSPGADCELEVQQERALVRAELRCIPPVLRRALDLVYFDETSIPEAAKELGISIPAFKSRLSRARVFLRERLEKHYSRSHTSGAPVLF